jgi:hypothetical protein
MDQSATTEKSDLNEASADIERLATPRAARWHRNPTIALQLPFALRLMGPLHWVSLRHAKLAPMRHAEALDRPTQRDVVKGPPDMAQLISRKPMSEA